jgi:DNA-binding LacI/PurR family transcriptional regulator
MGTFSFKTRKKALKQHPTIIDVARLAGVSKSTVSRVVNREWDKVTDATRVKVEAAIRELDYEHNSIASSLRTDHTNSVMLIIPDILNPFWPEVARGSQDFLEEQHYSTVFANSDWLEHREMDYLRMARRNRLDGFLINPIHVSEAELLALQIPVVIMGIREGYPNLDMVGSDSQVATQKALEYLIRLGHQRIGLLLGQSLRGLQLQRIEIVREVLSGHGLSLDENLIVQTPYDRQGGIRGMSQLLELSNLPTAVLASNDVIAIGAMQVAVERGYRVPADISIMGIDDIPSASMTFPPLTTIRKEKYEIGRVAARLLLDRMQDKPLGGPQKICVPSQLIVRGSTGPCQQRAG